MFFCQGGIVCVSLIAIFILFWCSSLLFKLSILLERKVARGLLCYKRRRKRLLHGREGC
jgi:hypothetical protein